MCGASPSAARDNSRDISRKQKAPPLNGEAFGFSVLLAYTLKDDPQPQVLFTLGFSNLKPAPSRVST
jgi:hypothetical protein